MAKRSMFPLLSRVLLSALLTGCGTAAYADIPSTMGGGNFHRRDGEENLQVLKDLGLGITRIPIIMTDYWNGEVATPEKIDQQIIAAHKYGVTPILLFEYYTRYNVALGGVDKWNAIGKAFAERFSPNSAWLKSQGISNWGVNYYTAINEPEWAANNPTPIDPAEYATALEGLADGIHQVNGDLVAAPGGFQEVPLMGDDPFPKAIASLYNSGKLGALDIHRYWDVVYIPMKLGTTYSLQRQFDVVKQKAGITANVKFYTTEMNFKKRTIEEDEAAIGYLTALWDGLTVVGNDGKRISQFTLTWNIFKTTAEDSNYGLALEKSPWKPTSRGKVLQMVSELTRGMEFVSVDPKRTGISVLEGNGQRLWAWQNREGWSSVAGTKLAIDGIPAQANTIEVYGWNGLLKSIPTEGKTSMTVVDLPMNQTVMLVARKK